MLTLKNSYVKQNGCTAQQPEKKTVLAAEWLNFMINPYYSSITAPNLKAMEEAMGSRQVHELKLLTKKVLF